MPQTLSLSDLASYGASPPPTDNGAPKTLTLRDLENYSGPPPPDYVGQGFGRSFVREFAEPTLQGIAGAAKAQADAPWLPPGVPFALQMARSMADQIKAFISHPSVANTPIANVAVEALARAQKQSDAGNQDGALGTLLGMAGQFIAPELVPAAIRIAPTAARATGRFAEAATKATGAGLKAGAEAAGPDLLAAGQKGALPIIAAQYLPGPLRQVVDLGAGTVSGVQAARGLYRGAKAGAEAARDAWAEARAAQAAAATPPPLPLPPRIALWQRNYGAPPSPAEEAAAAPGAAAAEQPPANYAYTDTAPPAAEPAPAGAPAEAATAAQEPAPSTPPAVLTLQDLAKYYAPEDEIAQREAYRQMRAEEREWTARQAEADNIAGFIVAHDLTVSPENLAKVARGLGHANAPSPETADMIADRVDVLRRAKFAQAASAPAPAAPDLEQQLRDSIAAAQARQSALAAIRPNY